MVTGRTGTLGMAVVDITNPHFAAMVKAANRVALAHGYSLMIVDLDACAGSELQQLQALASRVDGLAVSARVPAAAMSWLTEQHVPTVWFGRLDRPGLACVATDSRVAARMLGEHLVATGRRRVAYLHCEQSRWSADRADGLERALGRSGGTLQRFTAPAPTVEGGRCAAGVWFDAGGHADAVVGYNDLATIGFMRELLRRGVRVPDDVALAGFDNVPMCELLQPGLTSVDLRACGQGESMMAELHGLVTREREPAMVWIEPQLIVRDSTAVAAR
jgi:LacI family transcriptional regulator